MANPVILFYNLDNAKGRKLKFLCLKYKIRIKNVRKDQYSQTLTTLLADKSTAAPADFTSDPTKDFSDEMLIFCGFTGQMLDSFLGEFGKNKIPRITLKAVLTEQNATWDSYRLHTELAAEHEAPSQ